MGGAGGGGAGSWIGTAADAQQPAAAGVANTGGGGGGGTIFTSKIYEQGASGGSGIVCFREAQELPELTGTWLLNNRQYKPVTAFDEYINCTVTVPGGVTNNCSRITASPSSDYLNALVNTTEVPLYQYSSNEWKRAYRQITFPAGTTASDVFRAWLASNATKQS